MLGGGNPLTMRPVIRYAEADWERLSTPAVEKLPDGRNLVSWIINAPETSVDVAYCYPYGRPEVDTLVSEADGYWRVIYVGTRWGTTLCP